MASGDLCVTPARQHRRESGLYCGLAGRKEKLQEGRDALRPSCYVMLGTENYFKAQIAALAPAFFYQNAAQLLHLVGAAAAFLGADIEPDSRAALQIQASGKIQNPPAIPPYRGRKHG